MGIRRNEALRGTLAVLALVLVAAPAVIAAPGNRSKQLTGDGALLQSALAELPPTPSNLPGRQENMEVVGTLEIPGVRPGQIADLTVHKGFAYLNSWDEPTCRDGGIYVVDIRNPSSPLEVAFIPAQPATTTARAPTCSRSTRRRSRATSSRSTTRGGRRRRRLRPLRRQRSAQPRILVRASATGSRRGHADGQHRHVELLPQSACGRTAARCSGGVDNIEFTTSTSSTSPNPRNPVHGRRPRPRRAVPGDPGRRRPMATWCCTTTWCQEHRRTAGHEALYYWDAGYVQLDVSDPANPVLINDTSVRRRGSAASGHRPRRRATPTRVSSRSTTSSCWRRTRTSRPSADIARSRAGTPDGRAKSASSRAATTRCGSPTARRTHERPVDVRRLRLQPGTPIPPAPERPGRAPNTDDIALIERGAGAAAGRPAEPRGGGFPTRSTNAAEAGWDGGAHLQPGRPDDGQVNMLDGRL